MAKSLRDDFRADVNPEEMPTAFQVAEGIKTVEKKSSENATAVIFGGLAVLGIGWLLGRSD